MSRLSSRLNQPCTVGRDLPVFQASSGTLKYRGSNIQPSLMTSDFTDDVIVGGSGTDLFLFEVRSV
jgi:hypothetical protein